MTRRTPDKIVALGFLGALLSTAACNAGGDRAAEDAGAAATVVPAACQVSTERKPPLAVTFRFSNLRSAPVFLRFACVPRLSIASCASGYSDDIAPTGGLACLCEYQSCPVGGPCDATPKTIAAGASFDVPWDGSFIVSVRKNERECHERKLAVAAKYRVSAVVYGSTEDASANTNPLATVETEFGLGTTDIVEVPIRP